ncbi:MAG TPA: OmpA family protein [Bryobacteraceae bacterium]|nr:OmpA family protein [Bryobacteraceae bacterium]
MKRQLAVVTTLALFLTFAARGQNQPVNEQNVPIYRVTVIERTVKAVDYQYRNGPTSLDFRGTVLLPKAKGNATVESKAGRIEIDAHFDHVEAPTRYGPEYLTYVLWAITPEGHARNLGEVLTSSSDHAHLRVTTDLQAFGMIVTAEPYSAVREPSDVVVMENEVRPETIGHIEQVSAKYELLPRGHYTYDVSSDLRKAELSRPSVSMDRYEELVEVYQAQNAVQIAQSVGADHYAPDTFAKAEHLLHSAQEAQVQRLDKSTVVTAARQAAQTAEDARTITIKRKQDEELAAARDQAAQAQELKARAEADAQRAREQASADRAQLSAELDEERSARQRAEAEAQAAKAAPPPAPVVVVQPTAPADAQKSDRRMRLLRDLSAAADTRDTPRGLVVTLPDSVFRGTALAPSAYGSLSRVASIVAAQPGLYVQVEGNTDSSGSAPRDEQTSYARAEAVRDALLRSGAPANAVAARGLGSSRPLVSNASPSGREQNRRVEITISGDPIGGLPYWDKTYSLR